MQDFNLRISIAGFEQQGLVQPDGGRDGGEDAGRRGGWRRRSPGPHPRRRPDRGRGIHGHLQSGAVPADSHCQDRPQGERRVERRVVCRPRPRGCR